MHTCMAEVQRTAIVAIRSSEMTGCVKGGRAARTAGHCSAIGTRIFPSKTPTPLMPCGPLPPTVRVRVGLRH